MLERIINMFTLRHHTDKPSVIMPEATPQTPLETPLQSPDERRKLANLRAAAINTKN